jgi:hypothetical protein
MRGARSSSDRPCPRNAKKRAALAAYISRNFDRATQILHEFAKQVHPSRRPVAMLFLAYDVLLIAFGLGVWRSCGRGRWLHVSGALLVGIGLVGMLGPPWASMHLRGTPGTFNDTMHIVLTVVIGVFTMLAIGLAAKSIRGWFRVYSVATLLVLAAFGTLAGLDGPRIAAQLPTPWVGVTERINIGSYLLWVAILAITLIGQKETSAMLSIGKRLEREIES